MPRNALLSIGAVLLFALSGCTVHHYHHHVPPKGAHGSCGAKAHGKAHGKKGHHGKAHAGKGHCPCKRGKLPPGHPPVSDEDYGNMPEGHGHKGGHGKGHGAHPHGQKLPPGHPPVDGKGDMPKDHPPIPKGHPPIE